jgi:GT2 family glycosyltransferase
MITAIIVNYNEFKNIEIIYDKILKTKLPNHNFLIFDNGSTDQQTIDFVREINETEITKTFRSEKNLGFLGGGNLRRECIGI